MKANQQRLYPNDHTPITTLPITQGEKNQWFTSLTNEQHHSMKCISASSIKHWIKNSPWHWYQYYILKNRDPIKDNNDSFLMGTLIHMALLEPELYEKLVVVCDLDQRTKEYKEFIKTIPDGGYVIKSAQKAVIEGIRANVSKHKRAQFLIDQATPEQSGVAKCPVTGLWLSIRGDARGKDYFIDVKSCNNVSEEECIKAIINFGYGHQHAHYIETANLIDGYGTYKNFYFLFVSKERPHEVALYHLDADAIAHFTKKRMEVLRQIQKCQDSGKWPGADGENHGKIITLPQWGLK